MKGLGQRRSGPITSFLTREGRAPDAVIGILLVAVAFVLRIVAYQNLVAYPDEFVYMDRALATLQFNWHWEPQFMLDQPPLFMYLLSVISATVNAQLYTLRLVSVTAGSLTVVFVYLLGRSMGNRRVGFIAGALYAFNGFDILYSRIAQQEALVIFLMAGSVYFFWTGVAARRNLGRAIVSGVFLGVAMDTKYIALVLPAAYTVYILWAGQDWRNFRLLKREWWRVLASKEYVAVLLTMLLLFAPVLYILHQNGVDVFYWQLVGRFAGQYSPWYRSFDIADLVLSALSSYSNVLDYVSTWNASSIFPAYQLYADLTFVSLIVVLLYHLRGALKLRKHETFLVSLFAVTALVFLLFPNRFQYYELYTFTAYPVMFALLLDRAGSRLFSGPAKRLGPVRPSVVGTFAVLSLVIWMGVAAGTSSALYGQGAFDELQPFVQYVANHHEPNVTIAITQVGNVGFLSYYLRQVNVSARILLLSGVSSDTTPPADRALEVPILHTWIISTTVSLVPLALQHPQYVVLTSDEYTYVFTSSMKIALAQSYRPVVYAQGFVLLERIGAN